MKGWFEVVKHHFLRLQHFFLSDNFVLLKGKIRYINVAMKCHIGKSFVNGCNMIIIKIIIILLP